MASDGASEVLGILMQIGTPLPDILYRPSHLLGIVYPADSPVTRLISRDPL